MKEMKMPCFDPHTPELRFTPQDVALCQPAGCKADGVMCLCTLDRQDITLSIDPPLELEKRVLNKKPQHGLPFDLDSADDFSYIANLSQQGWELDQRFLDTVPPETLVARMEFPFAATKACSLGARRDEESRNVHPLNFRPHGTPETAGDYSQALAQQAVSLLKVPEQATVTVTLRPFGGNKRGLILKPGVHGYVIELSNMRNHDMLNIDDPCDDGIGREFAFFYELVNNKPEWKKRPVPHVKYTRWKSASDLLTEDCTRPRHTASSRPICPMASFN